MATCSVLNRRAGAANDIATFEANLDSKGLQFWTVSFKNMMVFLRRYTGGDESDTWSFDLDIIAGGPSSAGSWGAGWTFNNEVFFAVNNGLGIYKAKIDTINIAAMTIEVERAGDSVPFLPLLVVCVCGRGGSERRATHPTPAKRFTTDSSLTRGLA